MKRRATITLLFGTLASILFGGFGDKRKAAAGLLRPPGALEAEEFLATCLRCGKCAQKCPQEAIILGQGEQGLSIGTPYIKPRQAACNLCMDCISVCPSGALRAIEKEKIRMGTAQINTDTCLAWQGDECKICYTSCPFYNRAIQLEDYKRPVVNDAVCVGCGLCEQVCITEVPSITVKAGRR
jgi:ferredoxin-type protein NapG/ferredoxin-type protein NapH